MQETKVTDLLVDFEIAEFDPVSRYEVRYEGHSTIYHQTLRLLRVLKSN
jgi:hypothetical protein